MKTIRWRALAHALTAAGLVACSEGPSGPDIPRATAPPQLAGPFAAFLPGDPTAIPVGPPSVIEFKGKSIGSRVRILYPFRAPTAVNAEQLAELARHNLAALKAAHPSGFSDPRLQHGVHVAERVLAAQNVAEIRAALEPTRSRITAAYAVTPIGPELVEHTATYGLDGQDLLRVATRVSTSKPLTMLGDCTDDPSACEYDPNFDPAPVAADVATMQADVDAASTEVAALEAQYGTLRCEVERSILATAMIALTWKTGETLYYAWTKNVIKTYTNFKQASGIYGGFWVAFLRYKQCMAGHASQGGGGDARSGDDA